MGESNRDTAANQMNTTLGNLNTSVTNRFDKMNPEFGYDAMSKKMNEAYGYGENAINTNANEDIASSNASTAARLASQGITGGSILNDSVSGNANNINKQRFSSLQDLFGKRAQSDVGIMDTANNNIFRNTQSAQNVDFGNMSNMFQKYGLQMGNIGNLDSTTGLDDAFGVLNTGANIGSKFYNPSGGTK